MHLRGKTCTIMESDGFAAMTALSATENLLFVYPSPLIPEYGSVVLFNPAVSLAIILIITLVGLVVGTFLFVRSEKNW